MHVKILPILTSGLVLLVSVQVSAQFSAPVRFNFGAEVDTVDSNGHTWLAMRGDPQEILPNDDLDQVPAGCTSTVETGSVGTLDLRDAEDRKVFEGWSYHINGSEENIIEVPIENGVYTVNMYFMECGGCNRRFNAFLEGEPVAADISGCLDTTVRTPGFLSFDTVVADGGVTINLPACVPPECPTGGDLNSGSINGLEILPCEGAGCPFGVPVRFNFGAEVDIVDSSGNTWLRMRNDPQEILPNDDLDQVPNVCQSSVMTGTVGSLDLAEENDRQIFSDWSYHINGAAENIIEVPVLPGAYTVNMYFMECGGCNRRFNIFLENQLVAADESGCLAAGATLTPGVLSFDTFVADGGVTIMLPSCVPPECPTGGDLNSGSINGLEIISCVGPDCPTGKVDPCEDQDFKTCASSLTCDVTDGTVNGSWNPPPPPDQSCITVTGYELWRNGVLIETLASDASSFSSTTEDRQTLFQVVPIVAEEGKTCDALSCTISDTTVPFTAPARINVAGPGIIDSNGNQWFGDLKSDSPDPLDIRVADDVDRSECIPNIDENADDELLALGFDPANDDDRSLFNNWAYHANGSPPNEAILPIANGRYDVNLYFMECFNCNRHFDILLEDTVVAQNVSNCLDAGPRTPGRLSFVVDVNDGGLNIELPACSDPVECPGGGDLNSGAIAAIEVLTAPPPLDFIRVAPGESVQSAVDAVDAGGTVALEPGNHAGFVVNKEVDIVRFTETPGGAAGDSSPVVTSEVVFTDGSDGSTMDGVSVLACTETCVCSGNAVLVNGPVGVTISNGTFSGQNGVLVAAGGANVVLNSVDLVDSCEAGIFVDGTGAAVSPTDSLIHGNLSGVELRRAGSSFTAVNTDITGNGQRAIQTDADVNDPPRVIDLTDCGITGNGFADATAIRILRSTNARLNNCRVNNNTGFGILTDGNPDLFCNLMVSGSEFVGNSVNGIRLARATSATVTNTLFDSNGERGFEKNFGPNSGGDHDIVITNCRFAGHGVSELWLDRNEAPVMTSRVTNCLIDGSNNSEPAVFLDDHDSVFTNCIIIGGGATDAVRQFSSVLGDMAVIQHCTIDASGSTGIANESQSGMMVKNVIITNASLGMRAPGAAEITEDFNVIDSSGDAYSEVSAPGANTQLGSAALDATLRLTADSALAINTATDLGVSDDIDGDARPSGGLDCEGATGIDIGADEFQGDISSDQCGGLHQPGDMDGDGTDFSDQIRILSFLFLGDPEFLPCGDGSIDHPSNLMLLDAQPSGDISFDDAIYMLTWQLLGGPEHTRGVECIRIPLCPDDSEHCNES